MFIRGCRLHSFSARRENSLRLRVFRLHCISARQVALKPISVRCVAASTLATIVARRKAGFPTEALREMAGIGVADVKGNSHYALLCFAEQSSRLIHSQRDLLAGW